MVSRLWRTVRRRLAIEKGLHSLRLDLVPELGGAAQQQTLMIRDDSGYVGYPVGVGIPDFFFAAASESADQMGDLFRHFHKYAGLLRKMPTPCDDRHPNGKKEILSRMARVGFPWRGHTMVAPTTAPRTGCGRTTRMRSSCECASDYCIPSTTAWRAATFPTRRGGHLPGPRSQMAAVSSRGHSRACEGSSDLAAPLLTVQQLTNRDVDTGGGSAPSCAARKSDYADSVPHPH